MIDKAQLERTESLMKAFGCSTRRELVTQLMAEKCDVCPVENCRYTRQQTTCAREVAKLVCTEIKEGYK